MSVLEHLEELRTRLISALIAIGACSVVGYFFSGSLIGFLTQPARNYVTHFYFFEPGTAFMIRLKLAFFAGLFLSSPVIFYQIWLFMAPGLYEAERRIVLPVVLISNALFLVGAAFAYYLIIPAGIGFLMNFQTETLRPLIDINDYLGFATALLIAVGIVFNFPVFLIGLTKLHVVKIETLKKSRKAVVVIAFVLGAMITPSDVVVTQFLLSIPIVLLYEISIFLAALIEKWEHKKGATRRSLTKS